MQLINDDDDHDYGILLLPQRQCNLDLALLVAQSAHAKMLLEMADNIQENEPVNIELLQQWLVKYINANKLHP